MKKLLFLFMAVLACNYVIAQQKVYCEIVGTQKFAKSQVTVGIDFGQEDAMRTNALGGVASRNKLVGDDGKPLSFNSMVDAMNYMGSPGNSSRLMLLLCPEWVAVKTSIIGY